MHRLPTKTKSPVRMSVNGHQHAMNGDFAQAPVIDADRSPVPAPVVAPPLKLLRFPAIRERTGLSRTTIWRLERDGDFPRHRKISRNAVAWVEEEVLEWIRARISAVAV